MNGPARLLALLRRAAWAQRLRALIPATGVAIVALTHPLLAPADLRVTAYVCLGIVFTSLSWMGLLHIATSLEAARVERLARAEEMCRRRTIALSHWLAVAPPLDNAVTDRLYRERILVELMGAVTDVEIGEGWDRGRRG